MFLRQGFNDYLAKPIEMLKLHQILKKWIPWEKQNKESQGADKAGGAGKPDGGPAEANEEARRTMVTEPGDKKIALAVDDMPLNLTAIRTILGEAFDVRLAKSPLAALAMLNTVRVDLVLVDIEMPELSGFEFVDRLRNNPERPEHRDLPVIFVTSHETPDMLERIASYGAGYVSKPVIPRILLEKVAAALESGGKAPS
ncbi:MAG: response regulator, partial [Treponema sp.]|jgi:CheY-like chemotaxis protein|nr:response regulator [Treponema sp.]